MKQTYSVVSKHQGSTAEKSSVQKLNHGEWTNVLKPTKEVREDK